MAPVRYVLAPHPAYTPIDFSAAWRLVPAHFEGLPRQLEEQPMLRVGDVGLARGHSEEAGVETDRPFAEHAVDGDVIGIGHTLSGGTPAAAQLGGAEPPASPASPDRSSRQNAAMLAARGSRQAIPMTAMPPALSSPTVADWLTLRRSQGRGSVPRGPAPSAAP